MELVRGQIAVVTGAASGIGYALATAFAEKGLNVVMADVQEDALAAATERLGELGVDLLPVVTDVSDEASVQALAAATIERFGAVHVVCNNAGVAGRGEPWFGPIENWQWVLGVNLWGVIHGVRAFLPHLLGGGHIVNTASIAGLLPSFTAPYDASKHAVVAVSEELYTSMTSAGVAVGVSVLCPGWVRTGIMESERNWPAGLGEVPPTNPMAEAGAAHVRRAIAEGTTPAAVADLVVGAVESGRFWVFPHDDFLALVIERWDRIAQGLDPVAPEQVPGLPPRSQLIAEMMELMGGGADVAD
jgi:NAD(P)-dependent dehydrogenase (short-subunit alcohol dehydrogenase family)